MTQKTKKRLSILVTVLFLISVALAALPFVFKDKIMVILRQELNKRLTAEVDFRDLKISFLRSFPDASVSLKDLYIAGKDDFEGDTLLMSMDVNMVIT